jgi:hypothetical protein
VRWCCQWGTLGRSHLAKKGSPLLQGGEKEYYLASACKEVFVPPTAGFSLRGFKVAGAACQNLNHWDCHHVHTSSV